MSAIPDNADRKQESPKFSDDEKGRKEESTKPPKQEAGEKEATLEPEVSDQNGDITLEDLEESLEEALERVSKEAQEYLDGWQRARAEFANYKKRVDRDMAGPGGRVAHDRGLESLGPQHLGLRLRLELGLRRHDDGHGTILGNRPDGDTRRRTSRWA